MPKKIDGIRHYCLLLNESELEQAKQLSVKRDIRSLAIVGNTSCFIRYLIQEFISKKKE